MTLLILHPNRLNRLTIQINRTIVLIYRLRLLTACFIRSTLENPHRRIYNRSSLAKILAIANLWQVATWKRTF